ncbi:DUF4197 domain-containing protein [Nitratiruptor sp. YY09-18]|uniref:DUF4197 domain-containing protein n=1 Tax=Nitratiruptor sp. YY09-18 TaxID=2724901 RepID=UPI001916C0EA|nr:DUF4197 domain-containing protein [Nitratiruptor sp. YY09-18]BCD67717.1 hypothetical protein NitYY0918_C0618 [Nitratiruptor sp. YY09-18]
MKKMILFIACALILQAGFLDSLQEGAKQYMHQNSTKSVTSSNEEQSALHDALELGIKNAIGTLGKKDGFYKNPLVKIPLPQNVQTVAKTLRSVGMGKYVDNFELSMNRAAEEAVPETASILLNTARSISPEDTKRLILSNKDDAITQYFKQHAGKQLQEKIAPIIKKHLENEQVTKYYRLMMEAYNKYAPNLTNNSYTKGAMQALGMNTPANVEEKDLSSYVTNRTLDGIFKMIAQKEHAIRTSPLARTTKALKDVFGK